MDHDYFNIKIKNLQIKKLAIQISFQKKCDLSEVIFLFTFF